MTIPKMILFDFGQTLTDEGKFDGVRGSREILKYAVSNKYGLSPEQLQEKANELNRALGRFSRETRHLLQTEIPDHMFTAYLYESLGIKLSLSPEEIDTVFWDAAALGKPTEGIEKFLEYLYEKGIRTGVISNISFAGSVVKKRIHDLLPDHHFEFILCTSEYLFRKPHEKIFELALELADLRREDVWYIGDDYECDVLGAKNAGIFPVRYTGALGTSYERKQDVMEIQNWAELSEYIETCISPMDVIG